MFRIIPHALDNPESFRSSLTEQYPITHIQELGPLYESESYNGAVSSSDVGSIDVDDGAGLGDGADVKHGLVFGFDGCGMG